MLRSSFGRGTCWKRKASSCGLCSNSSCYPFTGALRLTSVRHCSIAGHHYPYLPAVDSASNLRFTRVPLNRSFSGARLYSRRHTGESSVESVSLSKQLDACQNGSELSKFLRQNPSAFYQSQEFQKLVDKVDSLQKMKMKPIEVSGLLNALSKASTSAREKHRLVLLELSHLAKRLLKHYQVKDISIVLNALARRNVQNDKLFQQAGKILVSNISTMNPQDMATATNAFAKLQHPNPDLFHAVATAAIPKIQDFTPQGLANLVNAFAKMNVQQDDLFDAVANETIRQLTASSKKKHDSRKSSFTAQGLANIANAFAKMNHHSKSSDLLFLSIAETAIPIIHTFNSQNLANTANAFAKTNHRYPELFQAVGDAAISTISAFNAQELSNLANAFAKLQQNHPKLFEAVAHAAIHILPTFKAQELSILVNAFAKMDHQYSPDLWDGVANAAISILPTFDAQELANLANAFAKTNHHHKDLFHEMAQAALLLLPTFQPQNVANLANAFAKLDHSHQDLFDALATTATPLIPSFDPQELANLVSATARVRADGEFIPLLFAATAKWMKSETCSLSSWHERNLVEVAYAFLKARETDPDLLNLIAVELSRSPEPRLDALGLGNLAAALSRQEVESSAKALKNVFAQFQAIPAENVDLQNVADVCKALWLGQKLEVVHPGFCQRMADYAIQKAGEARPADVRDIILNLTTSRICLEPSKQKQVLITYKPIFERFSKDIATKHAQRIREIYARFEIDLIK
jgi:hypothetical protein